MGRITVFSLDDCPHCLRTKAALNEREIPYLEISLTQHPKKRNGMLTLSNRLTVPQVFLNQTLIGGADETLHMLNTWDGDSELTPLQYYESFVARAPDPSDPRLQPPTDPPVKTPQEPPRTHPGIAIPTDRGDPVVKTLSVLQMTELLKSILPKQNLKYHLTTYKNSFRGSELIDALMKEYSSVFVSNRAEAVIYARDVLQHEHSLLDHVVGEHDVTDTGSLFFRLCCHQNPNVLNSYRNWGTERVDTDVMALVGRLKKQLSRILSDHSTSDGKVNYKEAKSHKDFLAFEEAVCELQGIDFANMPYETKLAFSINVYNLMIKYAFVKVGIGSSDMARYSFFNSVSFQLGPDTLSFQDLENGVLRGNRKAPYSLSAPFGAKDERLALVMPKVDGRIHFALNCGASSCPPVKNFTADTIAEELRIVAQAFCDDDANVRIGNDHIYLSSIFNWYQEDFGSSSVEVAETVGSYLLGEKRRDFDNYMRRNGGSVKLKYNKYDWSTDASEFVSFRGGKVKANSAKFF